MMVLLIFWLIEYFVCRNGSNFRPKFHKKATSGNTGLNFVLNSALLMSEFFIEMKTMENICPVLPEVAFTWNFGRKFDRFLHGKYSINRKIKSTIIFYMENATLNQMISHFDFLVGTLLTHPRLSSRYNLINAIEYILISWFIEPSTFSLTNILGSCPWHTVFYVYVTFIKYSFPTIIASFYLI